MRDGVIHRLEEGGYVCRVEPFERRTMLFDTDEVPSGRSAENLAYWGTTITGNALAKARIGRPMSRQEATRCSMA